MAGYYTAEEEDSVFSQGVAGLYSAWREVNGYDVTDDSDQMNIFWRALPPFSLCVIIVTCLGLFLAKKTNQAVLFDERDVSLWVSPRRRMTGVTMATQVDSTILHVVGNSTPNDTPPRCRIEKHSHPKTKNLSRAVSFSEDLEIGPIQKKAPSRSRHCQANERKPASPSSCWVPVRKRQNSTLCRQLKKKSEAQHKTLAAPSSRSNKTLPKTKSTHVIIKPERSKTHLKSNTKSPHIKQDKKSSSSQHTFTLSSPNKKPSSICQNISEKVFSKCSPSRSEAILLKGVQTLNSKLKAKKSIPKKAVKSSKYNQDVYHIPHERPKKQGRNAIFSTSASSQGHKPTSVVRPLVTRCKDNGEIVQSFIPPRKTNTPDIQSFKGQGAFTPLVKDKLEHNASWCNNTNLTCTSSCHIDHDARLFKRDRLVFSQNVSSYKPYNNRNKNIHYLHDPTPRAAAHLNPHTVDVNVNSLLGRWHGQTSHTTDDSADYHSNTQPVCRSSSKLGAASTNNHRHTHPPHIHGMRKENLNFKLSSGPKNDRRPPKSDSETGSLALTTACSSPNNITTACSRRTGGRGRDTISIYKHITDRQPVTPRRPLRRDRPGTQTAGGQRQKSTPQTAGDQRQKSTPLGRKSEVQQTPGIHSHRTTRSVSVSAHPVSRCGQSRSSPSLSLSTSFSDLINFSDVTRSETCRLCEKVPRPLTSHRHKPYTMTSSSSLRHHVTSASSLGHLKPRSLDKNNCSPSKSTHYFMTTSRSYGVDSKDSDSDTENQPEPGVDRRYGHVSGFLSQTNRNFQTVPTSYFYNKLNANTSKCASPRFKVNQPFAKKESRSAARQIYIHNKPEHCNKEVGDEPGKLFNDVICHRLQEINSYTDYLKRVKASDSATAKLHCDRDEVFKCFYDPTKPIATRETNSYVGYLKHCHASHERPSETLATSVCESSEKTNAKWNLECSSVKGDNETSSVKNAEVQTSPNLSISKSVVSRTTNQRSRIFAPRFVYKNVYRPRKIKRPTSKICHKKPLSTYAVNANKTANEGETSQTTINDNDDEVDTDNKQSSVKMPCNEYSPKNAYLNSNLILDTGSILGKSEMNTNLVDNLSISSSEKGLIENESPNDIPDERSVSSTSLNETYTVDNADKHVRPPPSPQLEQMPPSPTPPSPSPVKRAVSPQFDNVVLRPQWHNLDVNELDRRIERALKLREELQLRKQNKTNPPPLNQALHQIDQSLEKKISNETCTEDLRPSDTDEIASSQLDSSFNMDDFNSMSKTNMEGKKVDICSYHDQSSPCIDALPSIHREHASSTPNQDHTSPYLNQAPTPQCPNQDHTSPSVKQDETPTATYNSTVVNAVTNSETTFLEKRKLQCEFKSQQCEGVKSNVATGYHVDESETPEKYNFSQRDLCGDVCIDTLTTELGKLQRCQGLFGSGSAQRSSYSLKTNSLVTNTNSAIHKKKMNSTPTRLSKLDNKTPQTGLKLIGEFVESLPQVPPQSIVDWFLATSDPKDFQHLSKSGLSSTSSETEKNKPRTKSHKSKMAVGKFSKREPYSKSRLQQSLNKTKDSEVSSTSYSTPPTNQFRKVPYRKSTKPFILPSQVPYTPEPTKRLQKIKDRKTPLRPSRRDIARSQIQIPKVHEKEVKTSSEKKFVSVYPYRVTDKTKQEETQKEPRTSRSPKNTTFSSDHRRSASYQRSAVVRPMRMRTISQPPTPTPSTRPESRPGLIDRNCSTGVQEIVMKLRQRNESLSPAQAQNDTCRITVKKNSDVKGIIAKFSKR